MYTARDTIIDSLETYFKLPKAKRRGMSYLIGCFEVEMKRLEIVERDIAALVMPVYWVYVLFLLFFHPDSIFQERAYCTLVVIRYTHSLRAGKI